jgi:hypothetical protein
LRKIARIAPTRDIRDQLEALARHYDGMAERAALPDGKPPPEG